MKIAVVQGGPSSEAEVSRASAESVSVALREAGHRVDRLELGPDVARPLREGGFDVVFPVVHGAVGEDGSLQGLLEVLELPYVGSDVLSSALAMNKALARRLFATDGAGALPVAPGLSLRAGEPLGGVAERVRDVLGGRVVVKPCSNGSAIGVRRIDEGALSSELPQAILDVWRIDSVALVERWVVGKEVTVGVLDVGDIRAFPPTEIESPNDAFYTYEARYKKGRSVHHCPARLSKHVTEHVRELAVRAHRALSCRDLSRVDFVVGDGANDEAVTLLEVNTMPGFTRTSLYPEAAHVAGIPMVALVHRLVECAFARGTTQRNPALRLPS